jgi:NAD(P)H-dependent FMN reductase
MRIEIVSGSPRTGSVTSRVALHLEKVLRDREGHQAGLISVGDYNLPFVQKVIATPADAQEEQRELAERMFAAEAFVIVTPEYNASYSPAMQNLFDHFPKQHRKAFGLVTASTGGNGGIRAAMQLQQLIYGLFGVGSPYMLVTPHVDKKFDEEGNLADEAFQKNVDTFVHEFLWLAERLAR